MSSLQLWNEDAGKIDISSNRKLPGDDIVKSERIKDSTGTLNSRTSNMEKGGGESLSSSLLRGTTNHNSRNSLEDGNANTFDFGNHNSYTQTTIQNDTTSEHNPQLLLSSSMISKLKHRYDHLPLPPWPQLDHRTSLAILNGHMQGFHPNDDHVSPQDFHHSSNTIVTAYYEFESKHGVGNYEKWFSRILRTCEPMIIFVEPESRWFEFVKERRTHAPTIVAPLKFENLVMSTTFLPSFWDFMHGIDLEAKIHKGSGVYKIWNEKLIFMYAAVSLNPFETPGFVWMDAGYFRDDKDAPEFNTPIVKVNITEKGIPEEKLLLLHVRNDNLSSPSRVNIAGNAFVGTVKSFMEFYPRYYQTFWDWVSIQKFIGSDQFVMTETCRRYKDHCHPFFPGRFKMWFAMAYAMSGKRPFDQVSPEYLFLDEPPLNLPPVPSGNYVSFCNGNIVTGVNPETLVC